LGRRASVESRTIQ